MKKKTVFGLFGMIALSMIPIVPWYFLGPISEMPLTYDTLTHSLGQLAGLIGMSMFALTFVLATRLSFVEKLFGGLDKVYQAHSILGSLAFVLLLLHPLLLVLKFIPLQLDLAAQYLLPGHALSVNLGIIALAGMIVLLVATLYVNIKYHYWKMSHKVLGFFFILAALHVFLVRGTASRDLIFSGYYVYAFVVSAIGIIAFIYTLFFKTSEVAYYKVAGISEERKGVYDIRMMPVGKPLRYQAGQFAFFSFRNRNLGKEYHPYSIASATQDPELRIMVKSLGDYTSKLKYLKVGDRVSVEGPYGDFVVRDSKPMVWICAGIGVTPFLGMAKGIQSAEQTVTMYYCAREKEDFVALDELRELENNPDSKVITWCTSQTGRHLTIEDIGTLASDVLVYLCGPEAFKESFTRDLITAGVDKERIFEEAFTFK